MIRGVAVGEELGGPFNCGVLAAGHVGPSDDGVLVSDLQGVKSDVEGEDTVAEEGLLVVEDVVS